MIDKLKKIAELAPDVLRVYKGEDLHSSTVVAIPEGIYLEETYLKPNDSIPRNTQWAIIGRLIDDLSSRSLKFTLLSGIFFTDDISLFACRVNDNASKIYAYKESETLLEAVCDAWLSLKGG